MGRKALLFALCLCLPWAAAPGAAAAAAAGKSWPGAGNPGGAGALPGVPVAFGGRVRGARGGNVSGVAGKGSLKLGFARGVPGRRGCCGTRVA